MPNTCQGPDLGLSGTKKSIFPSSTPAYSIWVTPQRNHNLCARCTWLLGSGWETPAKSPAKCALELSTRVGVDSVMAHPKTLQGVHLTPNFPSVPGVREQVAQNLSLGSKEVRHQAPARAPLSRKTSLTRHKREDKVMKEFEAATAEKCFLSHKFKK